MKIEVPKFKRCCFCLPLRYGLLVWSYLCLIANMLLLAMDSVVFQFMIFYSVPWYNHILTVLFCVSHVMNIVLVLLLIVGAHRKNSRLLKIYYKVALPLIFANFVLQVLDTVYEIARLRILFAEHLYSMSFWKIVFADLLMKFVFVGMQVYVVALVRSETLKLENNSRFEFTNNAAEAECSYYNPAGDNVDNHTATDTKETNLQTKSNEENVTSESSTYVV